MDDRKPGKVAPEPSSMGAGWSLSHALDGATRRAKPKASLSRHLVGHRVALPAIASSADVAHATHAPEDAALVARSAQAGEAAWAHERVALIGRALDSEARRLAADPAKAGAVAEHLVPMIEKAFAGATAEAPGETARAIVGREREPFESELLSERAVMSVAAKQRAEREARNAALADELAMLKEQPQRWAAAYGRRARAIDDLPIDEKRRKLLKGAAARAQANAAAEGLLQQDANWLLEDLDDPDFVGALGRDDAARWRSEAEAAVARRAERIAAESAERAQLAASDMRATLKRFKDKDDGPLPPREIIAASLGSGTAADAALAAAHKGRKQRHAEAAVALMAPADETGWIGAAPDKETRTIREWAVATKRASVAGDAGRWLMRHSATLKELAKDATDDPAMLPRLADQYAALQNQVSGKAATGKDGAAADTDTAALPDAVAADLVEQVLAGETPQARLDVLTKILDGAAGGSGGAFAHAGALDADDRTRAEAIARQLEALGLPAGTAERWAQLTDPRNRRSARLALLGGFAKQIAEEQKILSGEVNSEVEDILGDDSHDTLASGDMGLADSRIDRSITPVTDDGEPAIDVPTERAARQQAIRDRVEALVASETVDEATAEQFLSDSRLKLLDEVLNTRLEGDPDGPVDDEMVASISQAADAILLAAETIADLEKEYGSFVQTAIFSARVTTGGLPKVFLGEMYDHGMDSAVNWFLENYYGDVLDVISGRLSEEFGIDGPTAERWATAGIFATMTGIGVAFGARDMTRFARHFVRSIENRRIWAANRPSLADEPFYQTRSETRNVVETLRSKHGTERYTVTLTEFLSSEAFKNFDPRRKNLVNAMFSGTVLPQTLEKHLYGLLSPLMGKERFKLAEQYVISLSGAGGGRVIPDLALIDDAIDPAVIKRLNPFLESVANGFAAIVEAKGPLQGLSSSQMRLRNDMQEIGRGDSFSIIDLPISEYPPDLLKQMVDVIIQSRPDVDPEIAYLLVDELRKHFHPKLPVWQLLAATSGILGLIHAASSDRQNGR